MVTNLFRDKFEQLFLSIGYRHVVYPPRLAEDQIENLAVHKYPRVRESTLQDPVPTLQQGVNRISISIVNNRSPTVKLYETDIKIR